ncbi:MAG: ATP-binding protein [bacterium]
MFIQRAIQSEIERRLFQGKALLLYGPRQSGKTTLLREMLRPRQEELLILNGDEADVRELLTDASTARLRSIIGKKRIVVIDEAQRIPGIGVTLKLMVDQMPEVQTIATGSSAFELAQGTAEPLTGRKFAFTLFPLAFAELARRDGVLAERRLLEQRVVWGGYPEIVTHPDDASVRLKTLAGSYLYKDLLMLEGLKKPALLEKLVRALALQVGSELSYNELAQLVGSDPKTVEKYVDLLAKAYVVFILPALARNARNEIKKGKKIYFCDTGIRNAVLGNFLPLGARTDVGALWENYLFAERRKLLANSGRSASLFFWRTTTQAEVDCVEEEAGRMRAWEFKWNPKAKGRIPHGFTTAYPTATTAFITPANYDLFLMPAPPDYTAAR